MVPLAVQKKKPGEQRSNCQRRCTTTQPLTAAAHAWWQHMAECACAHTSRNPVTVGACHMAYNTAGCTGQHNIWCDLRVCWIAQQGILSG
jgi:hypothetical protein